MVLINLYRLELPIERASALVPPTPSPQGGWGGKWSYDRNSCMYGRNDNLCVVQLKVVGSELQKDRTQKGRFQQVKPSACVQMCYIPTVVGWFGWDDAMQACRYYMCPLKSCVGRRKEWPDCQYESEARLWRMSELANSGGRSRKYSQSAWASDGIEAQCCAKTEESKVCYLEGTEVPQSAGRGTDIRTGPGHCKNRIGLDRISM